MAGFSLVLMLAVADAAVGVALLAAGAAGSVVFAAADVPFAGVPSPDLTSPDLPSAGFVPGEHAPSSNAAPNNPTADAIVSLRPAPIVICMFMR
jgi:hypothetical protein